MSADTTDTNLGKGEVDSSILSGSTIKTLSNINMLVAVGCLEKMPDNMQFGRHSGRKFILDTLPSSRLIDPTELAKALKVSTKTLERWRKAGTGPRFLFLGSQTIRYRIQDVQTWLRSIEQPGEGIGSE